MRGLYLLDSNENNNNENSNHGVIDPSALLGPPDPNGTTPAAVHAPPAYPQTPINRKKTKAKGRPSYPELCAIPPPPPSGDGGYAKASFASENSGMGATSGCGAVQHYSPLQPVSRLVRLVPGGVRGVCKLAPRCFSPRTRSRRSLHSVVVCTIL